MSENIVVANDEMQVVPQFTETVTYTKLDGTKVSSKADQPIDVLNAWIFEKVLMNPESTLSERKMVSKFKLVNTNEVVGPEIQDPDHEEFKVLWAKFLADPDVKITN